MDVLLGDASVLFPNAGKSHESHESCADATHAAKTRAWLICVKDVSMKSREPGQRKSDVANNRLRIPTLCKAKDVSNKVP